MGYSADGVSGMLLQHGISLKRTQSAVLYQLRRIAERHWNFQVITYLFQFIIYLFQAIVYYFEVIIYLLQIIMCRFQIIILFPV